MRSISLSFIVWMLKKKSIAAATTTQQRVEVENEIESETAKFRKWILLYVFLVYLCFRGRTRSPLPISLTRYLSVKCWMWKWSHTIVQTLKHTCAYGMFSHKETHTHTNTLKYADYFILCFIVVVVVAIIMFLPFPLHITSWVYVLIFVPVLMLFSVFPSFSISSCLACTFVHFMWLLY